jgi:hypothetical protein
MGANRGSDDVQPPQEETSSSIADEPGPAGAASMAIDVDSGDAGTDVD